MRVRRFCEDAYRVLLDPNHSFLAYVVSLLTLEPYICLMLYHFSGTLLDRATGQTNPEGAKGFSERLMEVRPSFLSPTANLTHSLGITDKFGCIAIAALRRTPTEPQPGADGGSAQVQDDHRLESHGAVLQQAAA